MLSIKKVGYTPISKEYNNKNLLRKENPKQLIHNDANHMVNGIKLNQLTHYTFGALDKLSPFLKNHSKIGKFMVSAAEKFIKVIEHI